MVGSNPSQSIRLHVEPLAFNYLTVLFNPLLHDNSIPQKWITSNLTPMAKPDKDHIIFTSYKPPWLLCSIFRKAYSSLFQKDLHKRHTPCWLHRNRTLYPCNFYHWFLKPKPPSLTFCDSRNWSFKTYKNGMSKKTSWIRSRHIAAKREPLPKVATIFNKQVSHIKSFTVELPKALFYHRLSFYLFPPKCSSHLIHRWFPLSPKVKILRQHHASLSGYLHSFFTFCKLAFASSKGAVIFLWRYTKILTKLQLSH